MAEKNNEEHLHNMRHSCAHLLAAAVQEIWPEVKLGVGPVIEHGLYYDFDLEHRITEEDFPAIEKKMEELKQQGHGYEREELAFSDAKKRAKDMKQPYKVELIETIEQTGSTAVVDSDESNVKGQTSDVKTVTFFKTGQFIDLCRGGHVENTKEIGAFKILSVAGAYWRGDEKNPMMQRIYVACFPTKKELEAHLAMLEEAKKRDHRKLGKDLDLFTFSDLVGPGLPLFTPKGAIVYNLLDDFIWKMRKEKGYEKVEIPHITKKDLYEVSGHWEKFADDLFKIETRDGHLFAMKPMNCPHHTQIFSRRPVSYRDMPVRYANTTMVYRDEQTGELAGLARVRSITQDDAHVFCRQSQIKEEFSAVWDIVENFYTTFGFDLRVDLSFHDPEEMEKYLGEESVWNQAEATLEEIAKERGVDAGFALGEAAFYGPKIDFIATDAIGRTWQVATIQLDLMMPERFDLVCTNEDGEPERIAMVHAAIAGSIERFLSNLIEHTAGKFPFWLSPVQVKLLPIADRHVEYAESVASHLKDAGYRVEIDDASNTIGKKIRQAELEKTPFMLIVGDKEVEAKEVAVRDRDDGDLGTESVDELLKRLANQPNPLD